jgi:PAS domain S-box-containing protein
MNNFLLEGFPEAILQVDKAGNILYCNPATMTLTGFSHPELLGKPIHFLTQTPEDGINAAYQLSMASSKGKTVVEGWYRYVDGKAYWAEMTIAPLPSDHGHSGGFVCILRDVTDRKQDELALTESEERFRLLVEGVQDYSIYMLDKEGHIITWNEGGFQLTGYLSGEIIGKHFSTFYTANDLAAGIPAFELETARVSGKYETESWRLKKNESVFWAGILLTAVYNNENKLIGFSKVTKDLSARRKEETILRQSEERYRSLVEQVKDYAIFMLDDKGRIVSWNEGAKRIKGYEPEEVTGKHFSLFYPQEEITKGKPAYELKIARQYGKYEEEGWRIRKDGSKFWANVIITAVYNTEGALLGFSKVTRDLTERKLAEQGEREIAEKHRQIARELEILNAELTKTNYDLEQFTSIVSHDLKEPLRTVKSFLHVIRNQIKKGKMDHVEQFVEKSILAADRMKGLIENLLDYSQVSKGPIRTEPLQLEELIEHVKQNLKGSIEASGAEVLFESTIENIITGDRIQLMQLLQNLISNAIKFTDTVPPVIKLTHKRKLNYAFFSVADNGIGMDADSTEKIFDPFRRLHAARNYPGAGMGLAICKKVVERHQGKIWVESQPGQGSTFHFTLWETGNKPATSDETI